jgi:hypothetical protein
MFNIFKKKEKNAKECFNFVIYDENMKIIAGVNNIELAKDICDTVAHDTKDRFYISSNTSMNVYCIESEQNRKIYRELREMSNPTQAPFIPFDHN